MLTELAGHAPRTDNLRRTRAATRATPAPGVAPTGAQAEDGRSPVSGQSGEHPLSGEEGGGRSSDDDDDDGAGSRQGSPDAQAGPGVRLIAFTQHASKHERCPNRSWATLTSQLADQPLTLAGGFS